MNSTPVRRFIGPLFLISGLLIWKLEPGRITGHHTPIVTREWKEFDCCCYTCPVTGYRFSRN